MSMKAGRDYGVEVVTAYENKRVGQVIYPPGALRQALVQRGLVRPLGRPPRPSEEKKLVPKTR